MWVGMHWRWVLLRKTKDGFVIVKELHKPSSRHNFMPRGWAKSIAADKRMYAQIRRCGYEDDRCPKLLEAEGD
jgi:hypothetical protein